MATNDERRTTGLHKACADEDEELVSELLQRNEEDANVQNEKGQAPLHLACCNKNLKIVSSLLHHKVQADIQDDNGNSALIIACWKSSPQVVLALLEYGVDVAIQANDGNTALMIACRYQTTEVISAILAHNPDVHVQENQGNTALMLACQYQTTEVISAILAHNPDVDVQDSEGWTALHTACRFSTPETVLALLAKKPNVNIKTEDGLTALHLACRFSTTETVSALLTHKPDVNVEDSDGSTALHIARIYQSSDTVSEIEALVDNFQEKDGLTSLYDACCEPDFDVDQISSLLSKVRGYKIDHIKGYASLVAAGLSESIQLFLKLAELPSTSLLAKIATIRKLWPTELPKVDNVLDWSSLFQQEQLTDIELEKMMSDLPNDNKYEIFILFNDSITTLSNLRKFPQFEDLNVLLICSSSVNTFQGFPDNLEIFSCTNPPEIMATECFAGETTSSYVQDFIDVDYMKQPPKEILRRGMQSIHMYFERGHLLLNSKIRAAFVGYTCAGKTSLVQSLIEGKPKLMHEDDRTQVVDISEFKISESQSIKMFDQGGHPVYEIANPYFLTSRSAVFITHDLSDPSMLEKNVAVLFRIIHQSPQIKEVHFVLTHIDKLSDEEVSSYAEKFEREIKAKKKKVPTATLR